MLFHSSVYISRHQVRLADKNCDVSVITLYAAQEEDRKSLFMQEIWCTFRVNALYQEGAQHRPWIWSIWIRFR